MNEKQPNIENQKNGNEKHINEKLRNLLIGGLILANLALPVGCGDKNVSAETGPSTTVEESGDNGADMASEQASDDSFYNRAKIYPEGTEIPNGWLTSENINYYKGTSNIAEGFCFEQLTNDQQAEIKRLESLSIEEFNALPQTEQLKYSYWLLENYKPEHDMFLKLNNDKRHFTTEPKTAEDLSDNLSYIKSMLECFCTTEIDSKTGEIIDINYDMLNAEKLVSIAYVNNGTYQQHVQSSLPELGHPYIIESDIKAFSYSVESDKTIRVNNTETVMDTRFGTQYHFGPLEYTNIHGNKEIAYVVLDAELKDSPQELTNSPNQKTDVKTEIINN